MMSHLVPQELSGVLAETQLYSCLWLHSAFQIRKPVKKMRSLVFSEHYVFLLNSEQYVSM